MFSQRFIKLTDAETKHKIILNISLIAKVIECTAKTKTATFVCRKIYMADGVELLVEEELDEIFDMIV